MRDHYERRVFYSKEDQCFIAVVPELRGCSAFGDTPDKALEELNTAVELWLETAKETGKAIPQPAADRETQGKILVRIPKSVHRSVIVKAAEEGVSLNQWIVSVISSAAALPAMIASKAFATMKKGGRLSSKGGKGGYRYWKSGESTRGHDTSGSIRLTGSDRHGGIKKLRAGRTEVVIHRRDGKIDSRED